jgi:hypothetical protein
VKLNLAERLVVNNPVRVTIQRLIIKWIKTVTRIPPQARVLEIGCGRGAQAPCRRRLTYRLFAASFL